MASNYTPPDENLERRLAALSTPQARQRYQQALLWWRVRSWLGRALWPHQRGRR